MSITEQKRKLVLESCFLDLYSSPQKHPFLCQRGGASTNYVNRCVANERYEAGGLRHYVPLVVKLVEEYKAGFESRYVEYPTPL
ncbi:hypothetical protein BpHYR1_024226 [Brachionus plicatilis]|uniref:Uncharacterized protein n=1 Tax=Brachionus plicatilis TaxID=10195 RepID=A0A3M7PEG1_BRAPC|nr:hypothetical protein BpHYR1_024226 [Brachionus plicatilis]